MDKLFEENIDIYGRIVRLIISISLIIAVHSAIIPVWFAFIATYPFFTALVSWEPIYAVGKWIGETVFGIKFHFNEVAKEI